MKQNFINQLQLEPFPTASAIVGGGGILGAGINAWATSANNRKQRNWNWRMYKQQRADSLADYAMQNEYNSPAAQMARYKAAGLNPNLIYGQTNSAAPIRSTDAKSYNPEAPQVDLGSIARDSLSAYYDAQQKPLQTDNLKKAVEIATEQVKLTQAQTAKTLQEGKNLATGNDVQNFDLALKDALRPLTLEAAQLSVDRGKRELENLEKAGQKIDADITAVVDQNNRQNQLQGKTLAKLTQEVVSLKAATAKTEQETRNARDMQTVIQQDWFIKELERAQKEYENNLRSKGIQPSDGAIQRELQKMLNKIKETMEKAMRGKDYGNPNAPGWKKPY